MTRVDYLIVGSGLTGATIARRLADAGREVLVLERRPHLGGNVHDFRHPSRIWIHTYGPHYFRCTSRRIWEFVNRFAAFVPFNAQIKTLVAGRLEEWPVNRKLFDHHPGWESARPKGRPRNFEEACLQKMPHALYRAFVQGYTRRQWGHDPRELDPQLAGRIRINGHHETSLTPRHRFQGLPAQGYAHFMENLLTGVPRALNVDYLNRRSDYQARKALIFTGPIDEFFGFSEGRLAYRGQRRQHEFMPDHVLCQPCAQINFSAAGDDDPIRSIEWKHLLPETERSLCAGTVITKEFPFTPKNPDQFEYPMPMARHRRQYERYRRHAAQLPGLLVCGRLGEYRYLDMNHAIERALTIADKLGVGPHVAGLGQ
jgi:UDP-galactopyranose mutase